MKIVRFTHVPLTTTASSPAANNGRCFQTVLEHSSYTDGSWVSTRESVNCGSTDFRRRDSSRRYGVEYSDGTFDFVSRSTYNVLRDAAGLDVVG